VTHPIRSGQQIVEMQGDLIILSTVSPGAEILARRHIHVYGALRGRALAGVTGDVEARIFCQAMDAELVSIAGNYLVNEDLKAPLRGKPAQIYLNQGKLVVQALP
jgi:septum site-determining protein MinC